MACVLQQLAEVLLPVGPAEDVDLLVRQGLPAEPRLKQTAGLGPCQIRGQDRVAVVVAEGLLGQQEFAAAARGDFAQQRSVSSELPLVENVAGCDKAPEDFFGGLAVQRGEGSAGLGRHGTSTGSWDSDLGRPC